MIERFFTKVKQCCTVSGVNRIKPGKAKVSGFRSQRRCRDNAANQPNSIGRVLPSWNAMTDFAKPFPEGQEHLLPSCFFSEQRFSPFHRNFRTCSGHEAPPGRP